MKRGGPLKRDPEKDAAWRRRSKGLKRGKGPRRRKPSPSPADVEFARKRAAMAFRAEAKSQRCCAVCGSRGGYDAHHVIEKSHLREWGLPQYVAANCLRLCGDCHRRHTERSKKVPLSALRNENIDYAAVLLGAGKAYNYLSRRYAGTDPRVTDLLEEADG